MKTNSEREEPKRYYLRHEGFRYGKYLRVHRDYGWFMGDTTPTINVQTSFTQEEIDNHEYSDIMKVFKKEEVK